MSQIFWGNYWTRKVLGYKDLCLVDFFSEIISRLENRMMETGARVFIFMLLAAVATAVAEVSISELVDVKNGDSLDTNKEELYLPDEDVINNTIDDTLGSEDIIEVVKNFIAEEDPMLQVGKSMNKYY